MTLARFWLSKQGGLLMRGLHCCCRSSQACPASRRAGRIKAPLSFKNLMAARFSGLSRLSKFLLLRHIALLARDRLELSKF